MKFSKIATVLLPISTVACATVGISSCSKSSTMEIAYGEAISCLDGDASYTSAKMGDILDGATVHVEAWEGVSITKSQLNTYTWASTNLKMCQHFYYDLLASLATHRFIEGDEKAVHFSVKWWNTEEKETIAPIIHTQWPGEENIEEFKPTDEKPLKYEWNETQKRVVIVYGDGDRNATPSYAFRSVTKYIGE